MYLFKSDITEQDITNEVEQNNKFKEQLIQDLYPGKEIAANMRKIKYTITYDDFNLTNVFGERREVNKYFIFENAFGEKALVSITMEDGCEGLTGTAIKGVKVYLPFAKREFLFKSEYPYTYITRNLETGKIGKYTIGNGWVLEEKYDTLVHGINGTIVTIGNKTGRIAGKDYNIPIKYDELVEIDTSVINELNGVVRIRAMPYNLVLVKLDGKWGAYCYIWDYHSQYINNVDKGIKRKYIKKRFIAPLFDKIEIHTIDDEKSKIILRVWLSNKVGLLEVYSREFICPIVFDEITKWVETSEGKSIVYGYIDGVLYKYSDDVFTKEEVVNIEYSEPYIRVREKIEKK